VATHDWLVIAIVVSALAFNVIAGINDGGNLLASAASSRTIPVSVAFVIIILGAFAGPLVFGTAVAATLGAGIADYSRVGLPFLMAAVAASLAVVFVANRIGFPTMMSLALVSAMVGSLVVGHSPAF
jgi:PiT family inorganic phosphate transporter